MLILFKKNSLLPQCFQKLSAVDESCGKRIFHLNISYLRWAMGLTSGNRYDELVHLSEWRIRLRIISKQLTKIWHHCPILICLYRSSCERFTFVQFIQLGPPDSRHTCLSGAIWGICSRRLLKTFKIAHNYLTLYYTKILKIITQMF